jgi:hypothetical protein
MGAPGDRPRKHGTENTDMKNPLLRNQALRNLIPRGLKALYAEHVYLLRRVRSRSESTNVYHCCVHKTGSQWLRKIFSDPRTYAYSGLRPFHYQSKQGGDQRDIKDRAFHEAFPRGTIVSPLYINYEHFEQLPKPPRYRALFVFRNPRDVLVSWYFSTRYSHPGKSRDVHREKLNELSVTEGMAYGIDILKERGLFAALESWKGAEQRDSNVLFVRYEDLIGSRSQAEFQRLFQHVGIRFPEEVLRALLEEYSFERQSGRQPGEEDQGSKLRKGVAGDWRNHFDERLAQKFAEAVGEAV